MNAALRTEWLELLARRRKHNTSGQDGSDFAVWLQYRGSPKEPEQMELFA